MTEVRIPDIGDFSDVEIIDVLVKAGDPVEKEQGLVTLETDKATMDVPSPIAGKLVSLEVGKGDKVNQGDLIAQVDAGEDQGTQEQPQEQVAQPEEAASEPAAQPPAPVAAAPADQASKTQDVTVKVPDIGDFSGVEIIEVLAAAGDKVEKEQGLITLETDKASMDVPSSVPGTISEMLVKVGDKVSEGDPIAVVRGSAEASPGSAGATVGEAPADKPKPEQPAAPAKPLPAPVEKREASGTVHASPAVRKLAREYGVDLSKVKGSGNKARVLKENIQAYVKEQLSKGSSGGGTGLSLGYEFPETEADHGKHGPTENEELPRIKRLSGPALHRNWLAAPHVTQFDDADVTDLESFRKAHSDQAKKQGFSLSPLAFVVKAVSVALLHFPAFNSSLEADGKSLAIKKYINVGIAVDTAGGLVVPVLRDTDKKTVMRIAEEMGTISKNAREGKLGPKDMQGGTFTISSLGGIGGTHFTPIINIPEVAILGVGRSRHQPHWDGKEFRPRLFMPIALSYDHRVIDGAQGARFITHLSELLSDIRNIVL